MYPYHVFFVLCIGFCTCFQNSYINRLERHSTWSRNNRRVHQNRKNDMIYDLNDFQGQNSNNSSKPVFFFPVLSKMNGTNSFWRQDNMAASSENDQFQLHTPDSFNFTRVGGYEPVKDELFQILDFFQHESEYAKYGVRMPRGLLLEGPTGNGKTLIARCFAGEAGMNFISCSGSEFIEKYVGTGAARVRELFRFAQKHKPCIIFIDELDSLGRSRSDEAEASHTERDQTLNQLLVLMDGFNTGNNGILIMGATNRVDVLDKALLRPGRFDKIIHVPNPDIHTRRHIVNIHSESKPLNVSTEEISQMTNGLSGAQIENLLNEATLLAIRDKSLPVRTHHLEKMKEKMLIGQISLQNKTVFSDTVRRRIAVHETGHLLISLLAEHYEKPWKVTIDSVNPKNSLGYTLFEKHEDDSGLYTREYLEDKIKVLLGGRAAEEMVYDRSISSGAYSDLEHAFVLAKKMIVEYGMGHIMYPTFSEAYKQKIDNNIHQLLFSLYQQTISTLRENKELFHALTDSLYDKHTLYLPDIQTILQDFE